MREGRRVAPGAGDLISGNPSSGNVPELTSAVKVQPLGPVTRSPAVEDTNGGSGDLGQVSWLTHVF